MTLPIKSKYPFDQMEIGDCMLIDDEKTYHAISGQCARINDKVNKRMFVTRKFKKEWIEEHNLDIREGTWGCWKVL